jgi:hypothetical protein
MTRAIGRSPVLTAFGVRVRALRGRFYVEQPAPGCQALTVGRVTPLAEEEGTFLLEAEYARGRWSAVARGKPATVIRAIAEDTRGTFYALGGLDKSLPEAGKGLQRREMFRIDDGWFCYTDSQEHGSVQEVLFHFFGLPLDVVIQPRAWYRYHRTPRLVEWTEDRTRVLVRFLASSLQGTFGGTCLYAQREGAWGAYPVKPSESATIATAEAWLVKRKWKAWI